MAWTYETVTPTLVPNTVTQKKLLDGVFKIYEIKPNEGYVLHDKRIDLDELDPNTGMPTGNIIPWFKISSTTVSKNYDFDNVTAGTYTYTDENGMPVTIPVSMIGEYEFYTLPERIVPTSQTCGGDLDHEVM